MTQETMEMLEAEIQNQITDLANYDITDEKEANSAMIQVETEKNKLDWKRIVLEASKVIIPAAVSLITLRQWSCKFERMLKFEETGHFTTSASRELHLPKLKF